MRNVLFAASAAMIIVAASVAGLSASEEPTWYLGGDERDPYLAFGNQELGENALLLICNNRKKLAELSVVDQSKGAKAGQAVTIELASANAKASFSGKTVRSAGVYGYARRIDFDAVTAMLRAPGAVTVAMGSNAYTLHDKGRAKAVAELAAACALK